jgi:hypothetical protein
VAQTTNSVYSKAAMLDPLQARRLVQDRIAACERESCELPSRVRVGGQVYQALLKGAHSENVRIDGVRVALDARLDMLEAVADAAEVYIRRGDAERRGAPTSLPFLL